MSRYGEGLARFRGVLGRWERLHVYDKHRAREFNKIMAHKGLCNVGDMLLKERIELDIFGVPCRYEQELVGHTLDSERVDKIGIFGHDNRLFLEGHVLNLRIGGAIALR